MTEDDLIERIAALESNPVTAPRINWPVLVVMVSSCLAALLIGITLPFARNASNTSEGLARNTEITGCRVTASAAAADALATLNALDSDNGTLTNEFQEALLSGDSATLERIRPLFRPQRDKQIAAKELYEARNATYQDAAALSTSDPDRFLSLCRQGRFDPIGEPSTTTTRLTGPVGDTTTTSTAPATTVRRRTTTTRLTTTTTRPTTTSTVHRSAPTPTAPPCTDLLPLPAPLDLPCL